MGYQKALERLEALEDKRLAYGHYYDKEDGCFCALGALARSAARRLKVFTQGASIHQPDAWSRLGKRLEALGLTPDEARRLQRVNDCYNGTPEGRYEYVLGWLRYEITWQEEERARRGG